VYRPENGRFTEALVCGMVNNKAEHFVTYSEARISVGLNQFLLLCTNFSDRYKMENLGFRRISITMHKEQPEMF
jgi:hypothetical protein